MKKIKYTLMVFSVIFSGTVFSQVQEIYKNNYYSGQHPINGIKNKPKTNPDMLILSAATGGMVYSDPLNIDTKELLASSFPESHRMFTLKKDVGFMGEIKEIDFVLEDNTSLLSVALIGENIGGFFVNSLNQSIKASQESNFQNGNILRLKNPQMGNWKLILVNQDRVQKKYRVEINVAMSPIVQSVEFYENDKVGFPHEYRPILNGTATGKKYTKVLIDSEVASSIIKTEVYFIVNGIVSQKQNVPKIVNYAYEGVIIFPNKDYEMVFLFTDTNNIIKERYYQKFILKDHLLNDQK